MASCTTAQFGNSYCPQLRLTVSVSSQTGSTATLSWTLQYVAHGYAVSSSVAKSYTVVVAGSTVKTGTYAIGGRTGTTTIASGTKTINKATSSQTVSFSCSMAFNIRWGGTYGGTKSASGSLSVSAKTSYTITYNANGGSGAPSKQTKWYGTNITLSSSKPARTGYSFQGWATSSSGSVKYAAGATYSSNASVTLYAVWKANTYTVSYNANGGSGAPSNQTKTYGVNLTLSSTKPTRTNYNFLGWGTSADSTTVAYSAGGTYTSNSAITLYAIWELAYVLPRLTNFTAQRSTSSGAASETGTYVKVTFSWATDRTVSAINVQYKLQSASSWTSKTISASGTSGNVSTVIGGSISTESSYVVRAYVSDSGGTTYSEGVSISTVIYPIDVKSGGKGVAFGKVAEHEDRVEFGWNIIMDYGTGSDGSGIIYGKDPDTGNEVAAFQPMNPNGNTLIGYGNYARKKGDTNIYTGEDIYMFGGGNTTSIFSLSSATGKIYVNRQSDIGLTMTHSESGKKVGFGVGSGGTDRGVYDISDSSWIIYRNSSNTTVVVTSSDARFKDNLGEISEEEMLALLRGIVPINFIYKNDEDKVVQNGFIAQNVRDILIENGIGYRSYLLIEDADGKDGEIHDLETSEEDVKYGLDYSKFTPLLVSGWQYHEKKIRELESEVAELKSEIEDLKRMLGGVE